MTVDHIRYDLLTQEALRGVVRTVLADSVKGMRGEHHFKISFDTTAKGVRLSPRLREQYPQEMTIVLQHQFWDLKVDDDAFEVGLSFGGARERLRVPFAAISGFFDPSVEFGLQFQTIAEEKPAGTETTAGERTPAVMKPRVVAETPAPQSDAKPAADDAGGDNDPDKPTGGAEVVSLDRFRKK
jgi:hypothetical protein